MNTKINTGGPAFPVVDYTQPDGRGNHIMTITGGMTLRQYAAINLRVPNSGTDWLDEMIVQSLRDEFATQAMQALLSDSEAINENTGEKLGIPKDAELIAEASYQMADDMLRAEIEAMERDAEQKPPSWTAVSDAMPEAGTVVLACYQNGHGNIRRVRAAWVAAKTLEATDEYGEWAEYDEDADAYYCPQGWYERVDNWDEMSHVAITEGSVTHWMPLPPAPAAAMQEKQS